MEEIFSEPVVQPLVRKSKKKLYYIAASILAGAAIIAGLTVILIDSREKPEVEKDFTKGVALTDLEVGDDISNMYLVSSKSSNLNRGWTYITGFSITDFIKSDSNYLRYSTYPSNDNIYLSATPSDTLLCGHYGPSTPPLFHWMDNSFKLPSDFKITQINWDNLPNGTISFKEFCSYQKIYSVLPQ